MVSLSARVGGMALGVGWGESAPRSAARWAAARPTPLAPPVITATLPLAEPLLMPFPIATRPLICFLPPRPG